MTIVRRDIREDSPVAEALDDAMDRWPRTLDAWEALTWNLAHDPEDQSVPLTECGTIRALVVQGARSNGWPTITVVYTYNDDYVTIRAARFTEPRAMASGRA